MSDLFRPIQDAGRDTISAAEALAITTLESRGRLQLVDNAQQQLRHLRAAIDRRLALGLAVPLTGHLPDGRDGWEHDVRRAFEELREDAAALVAAAMNVPSRSIHAPGAEWSASAEKQMEAHNLACQEVWTIAIRLRLLMENRLFSLARHVDTSTPAPVHPVKSTQPQADGDGLLTKRRTMSKANVPEWSEAPTDAERAAMEVRERERAWQAAFLENPLPSTPAQLVDECQRLRSELINPSQTAMLTVSHAPEVVERLWSAMRLMGGGTVPSRPQLSACSESAAWADRLLDNERGEALLQAIDAVCAWCAERDRARSVPTVVSTEPQAGGEGKQPSPQLQGPFPTTMRDKSSYLFNPSAPEIKHIGTVLNTAWTGHTFPERPELAVELAVYEAPGPRYIALSWGGPRTARILQGKELTAAEAAAEFIKDGRPVPPSLPLSQEALSVVEVQTGDSGTRPETPTPDHCLVPPNVARWEGTTELRPQLYQLFVVLLNSKRWPVPFDAVEGVVPDKGKNVSNKVSALNQALEPIKFPWTFRTKSAHITKD